MKCYGPFGKPYTLFTLLMDSYKQTPFLYTGEYKLNVLK